VCPPLRRTLRRPQASPTRSTIYVRYNYSHDRYGVAGNNVHRLPPMLPAALRGSGLAAAVRWCWIGGNYSFCNRGSYVIFLVADSYL
jgi:hypothetical protein